MEKSEFPGCCGIQIISQLDCLGLDDSFSKQEAAKFDTERVFDTQATLVAISNEQGLLRKQQAFLEAKGFKLLGTSPAAFARRRIYLYGSKEFKRCRS